MAAPVGAVWAVVDCEEAQRHRVAEDAVAQLEAFTGRPLARKLAGGRPPDEGRAILDAVRDLGGRSG